MEKKSDGFPNEKAIVIPKEVQIRTEANPITKMLQITDIGYYPLPQTTTDAALKEATSIYLYIAMKEKDGTISATGNV